MQGDGTERFGKVISLLQLVGVCLVRVIFIWKGCSFRGARFIPSRLPRKSLASAGAYCGLPRLPHRAYRDAGDSACFYLSATIESINVPLVARAKVRQVFRAWPPGRTSRSAQRLAAGKDQNGHSMLHFAHLGQLVYQASYLLGG